MTAFSIVASSLLVLSLLPIAQQNPPQAGANAAAPMTISGCLKKWDATTMGGPTGIQNPENLEYILTDLTPGAAAAPLLPHVQRFLVKPRDAKVMLSAHVNHRVEVVGTVTGMPASGKAEASATVPTLTVGTLKMISTECL